MSPNAGPVLCAREPVENLRKMLVGNPTHRAEQHHHRLGVPIRRRPHLIDEIAEHVARGARAHGAAHIEQRCRGVVRRPKHLAALDALEPARLRHMRGNCPARAHLAKV
jgi:hypothetical protein